MIFLRARFANPQQSLSPLFFIASFLLICATSGCTRSPQAATPDPATLLQSIAPADPAKYPSLQEARHWGNPYLVVRADRVGLLSGAAANEEQMLKPADVLNALAQLPSSAWPYGRAVAVLVDETRVNSEQERIDLRRNRAVLEGDLQAAKVAIRWIPTS